MITGILFSDIYRTMAYGILSVLVTYGMRNDKTKTRFIFYGAYAVYLLAGFGWLFFLISIWNESPDLVILVWGFKWICFFLVMTVVQHFVYKILGGEKDIRLLILNAAIVLVLCRIALHLLD